MNFYLPGSKKKRNTSRLKNNEAEPLFIDDVNEVLLSSEESGDRGTQFSEKISLNTSLLQANIIKKKKRLKRFGWLCVGLVILGAYVSPTPEINRTSIAQEALSTGKLVSVSPGTILLMNDENLIKGDHTITHEKSESNSRIWVWDFAAVDGDYVQILVNGQPVQESFMIKHKPVVLEVPTTGEIQVKGMKDGGGGITYAVRYEVNSTTYFNSAPEGEFNTYTLTRP